MEYVRRQKLGDFQIVAHLDSGGMADVYLARRGDSPEDLAVIKILLQKFRDEAEIAAMFREEARIMTMFNHPNVVQVLEHGEADGRPYIAMEYLAGDHLGLLGRRAMRLGEPVSLTLSTRIFLQVANALAYLHEACNDQGQALGLVHRDISPQNIFVTYDGRVKILDFGIALSVDRTVATQTGMLKGKLRYMSPEQVNGMSLDSRSDLFSLGIVMWEMLTGAKLFGADNEYQIMKKVCEATIPPPSDFRPDIPVTLESIVMGLLRRPLEERYKSAAQVRSALMELLREELAGSAPDEIARTAEGLLGDRKSWKENAIASLRAEQDLQAYLFEDLNQQEDLSDSGIAQAPNNIAVPKELNPAENLQPAQSPKVQPAPAQPRPSHPGKVGQTGRSGPPPLMVAALVVLFILGAGAGTLWILWPSAASTDKPSDISANAPAEPVVDEPAEPVVDEPAEPVVDEPAEPVVDEPVEPGVDEPEEPVVDEPGEPTAGDQKDDQKDDDPKAKLGFLMVKTSPVTQVYVDDRYVGKTPITEMELEPGSYKVLMVNTNHDIRKQVKVEIKKGEVAAMQYFF